MDSSTAQRIIQSKLPLQLTMVTLQALYKIDKLNFKNFSSGSSHRLWHSKDLNCNSSLRAPLRGCKDQGSQQQAHPHGTGSTQ